VGDEALRKKFPIYTKKKNLVADEIIAQRSAVPALPKRKLASDKVGDGLLVPKRQRTDYVPHRELVRLRQIADGKQETTVVVKDASYDVWDAPVDPQPEQLQTYTFIPPEVKAKVPTTLREKPVSLAANGKDIPAVSKPAGAYSYNPIFTDYEARYREEGAKAVEAERKRLQQEEADRLMQEAVAKSAAEAEAAEARAELSEWDDDSAWEGFESAAEDAKVSTKRPERKTKVQRNKAKRKKEEETRAKQAAALRKHKAEAHRIKQIAKEVAERERALALARAVESDSASDGDENELRKKQLGKFKLPEKDLELVLPDELQESLRLLKPEGNLLKDRYRSLLVRGKVETRRHIPFKKQAKGKMTEKWSYKDFQLM
jgi:nucleolar protein 53